MLKQRVLSAIVMIAMVCAALLLLSPFYFVLAIGAITVVGIWEWTQFPALKSIWRIVVTAISAAFCFLWIFSEADYLNAGRVFENYAQPLLLLALIWWFFASLLVMSYPKSAKLWRNSLILQSIFAFSSLVPFLVAVAALRLQDYVTQPLYGIQLLLYVFVLVWAADSGAYFVGRKFGKHKLAPSVSPGKTWQGVIGGIITSGLLAGIFIHFAGENLFKQSNVVSLTIISILTIAISILGDLTESMFKRESGVKDSSNLIPGHGGILDRIDSLLAATPVFAYFYLFYI